MLKTAAATLLTAALSLPALAEEHGAPIDTLFDALAMPEMIRIMSVEGASYGDAVAENVFGEDVPRDWDEVISDHYDPARMEAQVRVDFAEALEGQDVEAMVEFFTSDLGSRIIGLEISAREALLDEELEEYAKSAGIIAMEDETPRYQLVKEFIDTNDLVEANVIAALNSNVAFMLGLVEAGPMRGQMSEDQILSTVFSQEPDIRANTTEWILGYLLMAYEPLSDEEIGDYIAFSATEAGAALNHGLFRSFDKLYDDIASNMGRAAGQRMLMEEL